MAQIEHVLAAVPVTDIDASRAWYARLFGRSPDNNPMPTLAEWQITGGGWVQVTQDPVRSGQGLLNFAVSNLDEGIKELAECGVPAGPIQHASKGVELSEVKDPDGNTITLIGNFRVHY